MKILAVGNSFSQDATAYLQPMARAGGFPVQAANLFIPGCSLETHWKNAESGEAAYSFQVDGEDTGRMASLRESLTETAWDVVTLQQTSSLSGQPDSYQPFLAQLYGYVRALAPQAKVYLHETWAYETDSGHEPFALYRHNQEEMYRRLKAAYIAEARRLGLPLIPSGDAIQAIRRIPAFCYARGGLSLCRDGFHMQIPYGRYALSAVWYETLFGADVRVNTFVPNGREGGKADQALLDAIRETVHACLTARE